MPEVSERAASLANKVGKKYGTPSLVFRGAVMKVEIEGMEMRPVEFLGFEGTSSTFLVTDDGNGGYNICSVKTLEEPKVMRNRLKQKGLVEVVTCVECVEPSGNVDDPQGGSS